MASILDHRYNEPYSFLSLVKVRPPFPRQMVHLLQMVYDRTKTLTLELFIFPDPPSPRFMQKPDGSKRFI